MSQTNTATNQMNTATSFHPIQSYRHLCNRLDSNSVERDQVLIDIANERKAITEAQQRIAAYEFSLSEVAERRSELISEGRELLPSLRGFKKCFDCLLAIIQKAS